MVAIFEQIAVGQWFRFVAGFLEIVGGLLVLVPFASVWGALLFACVMAGAAFTDLVIGDNPASALILLALSGAVLWLRRQQVRALIGR